MASLERTLLRAEPAEDLRAEITRRLRELLARWDGARPDGGAPDPRPVAAALESATDDQLFALIDGELPGTG